MPSGIQHWLEAQLEARGIDSTIHSKYVLAVLCNDSADPLINTPKDSKVKYVIEELRVKIKEFQKKGTFPPPNLVLPTGSEGNHSNSTPEKSIRYYSAFPTSIPKPKTDHSPSSLGSLTSSWSGKRVFGNSVGKNRTISEGSNKDLKLINNKFDWLEENKENNGFNRDVNEKIRSRSTVKQQTPDKAYRNMAKSLDRKDDLNCKLEIGKTRKISQQSDLASEQIQAIWTTEKSFDDLSGCDQDLPMDFQQLLESPETSKMSLDVPRCVSTKQPSSFIQCGTNITSSIWSENVEDTMDCSVANEANNNLFLSFKTSVWGTSSEGSCNQSEKLPKPGDSGKRNIWSTAENNVFSDMSWSTMGNPDCKEHVGDFEKWSDVEGTRLLLNDADNFFSSIGATIHSSLTTLNHNKEDSSFTEVIPKVPNIGFSVTKDVFNLEPVANRNESTVSKKEEEDLLTSMKTHFRPIKQETVEIIPSSAAPSFPDGTTFPISNCLDDPNFHRSPGGGLYLDSDNNKYMEYNDAEDDTPSEFVPKFRVRQNEKFCQTEEVLLPPQNYQESDCEELYFPEDEKLVRDMVEEDEIEEGDNVFWGSDACIKVDGWMATWPASGIWSNEPNVQQIWCGGSMWNTSSDSNENEKPTVDGEGDQYTRLRNEWTQEAEELLSDISQHLVLANYTDSQPPKATLVESAWGPLSTASFSSLPFPPSYPVMQS